jgi:hypothetical protein
LDPSGKQSSIAYGATPSGTLGLTPFSAYLPPTHPHLTEEESGKVCPVTNATLEHHKSKVHEHPSVAKDAPVAKCPVANTLLNA